MATTIVTKNSSTASAVPTAGQLVQGELAVNVADKRLYTEDNAGAVVELGTNPSTLTVTGEITANGGIALGDGDYATFGDSDDLEIFHSGTESVIRDVGTGRLVIRGTNLDLETSTGEYILRGIADGATQVYHNGSEKLSTTATGIDVTGTATMDGLTVDGTATVTGDTIKIDSATHAFYTADRGDASSYAINRYYTAGTESWRVGLLNDGTSNFHIYDVAGSGNRLSIGTNGDISFYEDTGTTAKLFWDASAESLGIGTSSPTSKLQIGGMAAGEQALLIESARNDALSNGLVRINITDSVCPFAGLQIDHAGTGAALIANGNVGIGTSSPAAVLHAAGSTGLILGAAAGDAWQTAAIKPIDEGTSYKGSLAFYTHPTAASAGSPAERMRIDASGNVGIGVTPLTKLHVQDSTGSPQIRIDNQGTASGIASLLFRSGGAGNPSSIIQSGGTSSGNQGIVFKHGDFGAEVERMRIDASGNLLVGTTDTVIWNDTSGEGVVIGPNAIQVARASDTCLLLNRQSTDGLLQVFASRGVQVGSISVDVSSTAYNTSSDQRLKENITDANDAGDKIDAIKVRQYDWKVNGSHQDYGMIAQELLEVAPEAVHQPEDSEEMMGVDYSKLVPMLIKEIQSLRNRVAQLEA
jgi:hypothetical protein